MKTTADQVRAGQYIEVEGKSVRVLGVRPHNGGVRITVELTGDKGTVPVGFWSRAGTRLRVLPA
ncbi:hypothetical protein CLV63_14120 [Murinocardiopsis flavida]|uniref:Uncharacterized protein n=1 Tax=Murinocardiopsis flavida TaxID=645275 RepID=A0A2P8CDL3_9ACTN|nr:hypothetical protein [Murinocardiopsis flavida]PSK83054.1 hypothetical protein CLV63_14120 [Murinocardiopsis flavida]